MNLYLARYIFNIKGDRNIIGDLYLDKDDIDPFCYTLEDELRADGVKVYGKTAIDAGTYDVEVTWSPRFKQMMPLLLNVPNFEGIRIHNGQNSGHSSGCILVGSETDTKTIWGKVGKELTKILMDEEKITITIENKPFTHK